MLVIENNPDMGESIATTLNAMASSSFRSQLPANGVEMESLQVWDLWR